MSAQKSQKGTKPDKTMSSRLLTMKFMQRAAASKEDPEPSTPSPKRQRLSSEPQSSPGAQSEREAISAAIAAEEEKRREAVSRQAAEAGESEWVLELAGDTGPVAASVVDAGSLDDDCGGRQSYGNFKRKKSNLSYLEPDEPNDKPNEKPKPKREPNLKHATSLSGTRQGLSGDQSQKKRKQK